MRKFSTGAGCALLLAWGLGSGQPVAAATETTCKSWLATDPAPSGVPALSGPGAAQRSALLADGGKLVLIGSRYYAVWFPQAFYTARNPVVIFDLHGTGGYPEAEWNDWHSPLAAKGYAFVGLAWGGGTPSVENDTTVYSWFKSAADTVAANCPVDGAAKWLMGFSVGSAYSFAVAIRDVADRKMFRGQIAISGAAISPLTSGKDLMHPTVEAARASTGAVQGIKAWMYCGENDFDHGWSMCDEMPNGESFVNAHGGSATLYRDPTGTHGSLPYTAAARNALFGYVDAASRSAAQKTGGATLMLLLDD